MAHDKRLRRFRPCSVQLCDGWCPRDGHERTRKSGRRVTRTDHRRAQRLSFVRVHDDLEPQACSGCRWMLHYWERDE